MSMCNFLNHTGKIFRHYRNKQLYEVICLANCVRTQKELVVYQELCITPTHPFHPVWVRDKEEFFSVVDTKKGKQVSRFEEVMRMW